MRILRNRIVGRCGAFVAASMIAAPVTAAVLDGSVDVVSDYRFRGVSLSDRQPVVDASVDVVQGAWFAGVEAISSARVRSPDRALRDNAEADVSAGWSRSFGLLTPAVGVITYLHPGGGQAPLVEGFASVAGALGPATLTVGANYAPAQAAVPGGNLYLFTRAAAAVPGTPLTLKAGVGREAGALAGGRVKLDWSAGVEARVLRLVTVGFAYVGNDLPVIAGPLQHSRSDGIEVKAGISF